MKRMTAGESPVPGSVTGVVLAGGQGSRMGGIDKGLQTYRGVPLALNALLRLRQQRGDWIGDVMINANRHLGAYEGFGVPVWPDTVGGFAGPLAGMLTALTHAQTPFVLTVPCDAPRFPLDLADRMCQTLIEHQADLAMAAGPEADARVRTQPVFLLLGTHLLEDLDRFLSEGGRKIDAWTARHRCVPVAFDRPNDDPLAFANVNTLADLHALETKATPAQHP